MWLLCWSASSHKTRAPLGKADEPRATGPQATSRSRHSHCRAAILALTELLSLRRRVALAIPAAALLVLTERSSSYFPAQAARLPERRGPACGCLRARRGEPCNIFLIPYCTFALSVWTSRNPSPLPCCTASQTQPETHAKSDARTRARKAIPQKHTLNKSTATSDNRAPLPSQSRDTDATASSELTMHAVHARACSAECMVHVRREDDTSPSGSTACRLANLGSLALSP